MITLKYRWTILTAASVAMVLLVVAQAAAELIPTSGLQVWLDAGNVDSSNNSTLTDGSAIGSWYNRSSDDAAIGNFTQSDGGLKPTLKTGIVNSKPVVRFDIDRLDNSTELANSITADMTTFVVADNGAGGNTYGRIIATRTGDDLGWILRYNAEDTLCYFHTGYADSSFTHDVSTGFDVVELIRDGTVGIPDSTTVDLSHNNGTHHSVTTSNFGVSDVGTSIGAAPGGSSATLSLQGDIAELIVYNRVLDSTEINQVGYYLAGKYDITTAYIPEPSSVVLLAMGALGLLVAAWRRRRK